MIDDRDVRQIFALVVDTDMVDKVQQLFDMVLWERGVTKSGAVVDLMIVDHITMRPFSFFQENKNIKKIKT